MEAAAAAQTAGARAAALVAAGAGARACAGAGGGASQCAVRRRPPPRRPQLPETDCPAHDGAGPLMG